MSRRTAKRGIATRLLRLMAGASPELAGFAFMCDGVVEANRTEAFALDTDGTRVVHAERVALRPRSPLDHPPATAHLVHRSLLREH